MIYSYYYLQWSVAICAWTASTVVSYFMTWLTYHQNIFQFTCFPRIHLIGTFSYLYGYQHWEQVFIWHYGIWHCRYDWKRFKNMLSLHLKQVWGGMPIYKLICNHYFLFSDGDKSYSSLLFCFRSFLSIHWHKWHLKNK